MRFGLLLIPALVSMGSLVAADAVLTVTGVEAKGGVGMPVLTLTLDDLAKMPRTKASMNEDKHTNTYEGVPVYEILKRAGQPFGKQMRNAQLLRYAIFRAHDGYRALFALPEFDPGFTSARAFVADRMDGKPLPSNRGPLRLIIPGEKDGARGVYMLERIEIQGAAEPMR
jgi:DMSO/TMAO reductase YedYZ molybdopterin-dependent catalytic subunit